MTTDRIATRNFENIIFIVVIKISYFDNKIFFVDIKLSYFDNITFVVDIKISYFDNIISIVDMKISYFDHTSFILYVKISLLLKPNNSSNPMHHSGCCWTLLDIVVVVPWNPTHHQYHKLFSHFLTTQETEIWHASFIQPN